MKQNTQYKALFIEYDDLMIGKRKEFSDTYFSRDKIQNMEHALLVMRYAFDTYLGWSPEALSHLINKQLLEELSLYPLMKHIRYPIEYDKEKDYYYLVTLIYQRHTLGLFAKTIHSYEAILSNNKVKYPKDYFVGRDGLLRSAFCLQYMITHYVQYRTLNDLYSIFSTEEAYQYLRKYKLYNVCRDYFDTPVDYLHYSLSPYQRSSFFYHYYKFKYMKEMRTDSGRKRQTTKDYKLKEGNVL